MSRIFVDFENRRAIIVGDGNYPITLTTVRDLGGVVTEALDFEGTWPAVGGLRGTQTTVADLIKLGEKLRGIETSIACDAWCQLLISDRSIQCRKSNTGGSQGRATEDYVVRGDQPSIH